MIRKNIIKRAACAVLSASLLCTSIAAFAAEKKWTQVYSGDQVQSSHGEDSEIYTDLYSGKLLSGTDGEVYRITWEGKWYDSGIDGGTFKVTDSKMEKDLFWRTNLLISNQIQMTDTPANPELFKFIMTFDFGAHQALIEVFDTDQTTKLGELTASLSGMEGITGIYYRIWSNGNIFFSKINATSLFTIEKDTTGVPDPSEVSWEEFYQGEGADASHDDSDEKHYHDLYSGLLSAEFEEQYEIQWNASFYRGGGVNNGDFILSDGTKELVLFSKGKNNNQFGSGIEFGVGTDDNPHALAIDTALDFAEETATVKFYDDKNRQTLLGTKTVSLEGLDGVRAIYYHMPEINGYTSPRSSSVVIKRGSILPMVRGISGSTASGKTEVLYGKDALDLTQIKLDPTLNSLSFDLNVQVNMQDIDNIITLTKEGETENLLTGFKQKGVQVTAELSEELTEDQAYVLAIGTGLSAEATGYSLKDAFSLSFTAGKRTMSAEVSNLRVENGALMGDISLFNSAAEPKQWIAAASCYDAAGKMIWCGAYENGQPVDLTETTGFEIALPNGALPEGAAKTVIFIWDSVAAGEIYAAETIAEGI